jgi:hypothetical protein
MNTREMVYWEIYQPINGVPSRSIYLKGVFFFLVALLTFELDKASELHFGGVHLRLEATRT